MSPDDERHGTAWGYSVHFRDGVPPCQPCREAKSLADRRRRRMKAQGKEGRQPLGASVYGRVKEAKSRHISNARIATLAGISESTVERILRLGPDATVATNVKARLAVMPAPTVEITGIGYTRRLRALACLGYSCADFAREAGIDLETVKQARRHPPRIVRRVVRDAIIETYDRLCLTPRVSTERWERGVITLTVNTARREGWAPPLAYEDIDDPNEIPTGWEYEPATRAEVFTDLVDQGGGVTEVATRLGLTRVALEKWCGRNGYSAVFSQLVARETAVFEYRNQHAGRGAA